MSDALRSSLVIASLAIGLSACGSVLPERAPPPDLYRLAALASPADTAAAPLDAQLLVEEPAAPQALDTDRIAVKPNAYELGYLSGARWTDRAPRVIQTALIEALEGTRAFAGIGRPTDGLKVEYALLTDLRAFEVDSSGSATNASIVVAAKLVRRPSGAIVAARVFEAAEKVKGGGREAMIAAFSRGVETVARETASWAADNAGNTAASKGALASGPAPIAPTQ